MCRDRTKGSISASERRIVLETKDTKIRTSYRGLGASYKGLKTRRRGLRISCEELRTTCKGLVVKDRRVNTTNNQIKH